MTNLFRRLIPAALALSLGFLPAIAACGGGGNGEEAEKPPVTDPQPSVYEIAFDRSELLLADLEGYGEASLSATVYCDGTATGEKPVFTVRDQTVAKIDGERVTALKAGETVVTASYTANGGTVSEDLPLCVLSEADADTVNSFDEEAVNLFGRTYFSSSKLTFDNVCTGIEVAFAGTSLTAKLSVSGGSSKVRVYVDGETEGRTIALTAASGEETALCEDLEDGIHTVRILKALSNTSSSDGEPFGRVHLPAEDAFSTDGSFVAVREKSELKIEIIGDSITAGCGANGTSSESKQTLENSDATLSFAYLTAQALGADFSIMALEGICAKDGNLCAYDTYQKQFMSNSAPDYDPSSFDADVVVLALGENDVWHATSDAFPNYNLEKFRADYADMLRLIRTAHPSAKIVCVFGMMPASARTDGVKTIKDAIADTGDTNITALQMRTNEKGANSHPNAATHKLNAERLTSHILGLLGGE